MNKYAQMADRLYDQEQQMKRLEKENAELDCQKNRNKFCYSCANATERCFRKEIGCPCEKYKSYKEKIEELEKESNRLFLEGAKRVEELEAQIEKMKCCENCKHSDTECEGYTICGIGHYDDCLSNKVLYHTTDEKDYWELQENEL